MQNKKNKSGFTLVEVVVVMTIVGILFGAILNLLQPVNQSYRKAETIANTNAVGSGLNKYIEGQIRFSTNILVLDNYKNVPQVNKNGTIGSSPICYTDCIVIDNSHVRGSQLAGYDPDATTAHRMGCTGTVLRVTNIDKDGFDMKNAIIGMGEDYYGIETYSLDASMKTEDGLNTFGLVTKGYQYSVDYSNGSYKFSNKSTFTDSKGNTKVYDANKRFESKREFDLINVNIDPNDKFKAKYVDMNKVADGYTTYPKATTPTGTEAGQQVFYTDSNKYTYIFYTKSSADVKCTLYFNTAAPGEADKIIEKQVNMGDSINLNKDVPKSLKTVTGYDAPYYICTEDGNSYKLDDAGAWKSIVVTQNLHFTAQYDLSAGYQLFSAKFFNLDGTFETYQIIGTLPVCNIPPLDIDNDKQTFIEWNTEKDGSGTELSHLTFTADYQYNLYPIVKNKPKVTFKNGTDVIKELYVDVDTELSDLDLPDESALGTVPTDKCFAGWYNGTTSAENYKVTTDVVFNAKFISIEKNKLTVLSCKNTQVGKQEIDYEIKIGNGYSNTVNVWSLSVPLSSTIEQVQGDWHLGDISFNSGNVSLKTKDDHESNYLKIEPNKIITITLKCYNYSGGYSGYTDSGYKVNPGAFTVNKIS